MLEAEPLLDELEEPLELEPLELEPLEPELLEPVSLPEDELLEPELEPPLLSPSGREDLDLSHLSDQSVLSPVPSLVPVSAASLIAFSTSPLFRPRAAAVSSIVV